MRRNWFLNLIFSLICIISILFLSIGVYASTSYHAEDSARVYLESSESVIVEDTGDTFVFSPNNIQASKGIIFYPGALVDPESYAPLFYKLAENGIKAYIVKMPYNLAFFKMGACDTIVNENHDINEFYVAGHSLGGAIVSSNDLDSYKGLILLASYSTKQINIPTLLIRGENDGVLGMEKYNAALANYSSYNEYVIAGGNHAGFAMYGHQKKDNEATISNIEQIDITVEKILAFIG